MISILFLAADPTDVSRLRLGEEFREIHEKLQLSRKRDSFLLDQRLSVRPVDISQALLDVNPQIVHFSGHGTELGALCVENDLKKMHPIDPEILGGLFSNFASHVNCVILNACFSALQASFISKHVPYVVGMKKAIGDRAAIAFSIGFYQALGAGRSIEDSYKLGCVQIGLNNIPESLTPTLLKSENRSLFLRDKILISPAITFEQKHNNSPVQLPIAQLRKHLAIVGWTGSGRTTILNWITGALWEEHSVPFLAIRHWHGLSQVSQKVANQISHHRLQDSMPKDDNMSSPREESDEKKVVAWLDSIQDLITIDYLSKHPTVLDINLKDWEFTREAFKLVFKRIIKNLNRDFQTDQLRLTILIDELDSIYGYGNDFEFSQHLDILRRCGVGVVFTCGRLDYVNHEVRNFILLQQGYDAWGANSHKFEELKGVEEMGRGINSPGEGILSSRGVINPTLISAPYPNTNLCTLKMN